MFHIAPPIFLLAHYPEITLSEINAERAHDSVNKFNESHLSPRILKYFTHMSDA